MTACHVGERRGAQLEVLRHPFLQQGDEFRLHERVVVRDVETRDAFARQLPRERAFQLLPVRLLHHDDEVGPLHLVAGEAQIVNTTWNL